MIQYHAQKGDLYSPVVSHSLLNLLDPEIGGHPSKVKDAILNGSNFESKSLETGTMLHDWMEKEASFAIEELDKPAEQMARFAETFYNLYFLEKWKEDLEFFPKIALEVVTNLDEQFKINEIFQGLFQKNPTDDEFVLFTKLIYHSRVKAEVNKQLTNPKVLEKFTVECLPYIKFLQQANGKIILDKSTKNILINAKQSINNHPFASKLIETCQAKEVEFFWTEKFGDYTMNRKAKIDRGYSNFDEKHLIILDFKTTSKPIADFNKEYGAYYKYKLGRQLENYAQAFFNSHDIYNREDWKVELYNVVVQTTETFPCSVFKTNFEFYEYDLNDITSRMNWHIKNQEWSITLEEAVNGFIQI